MTDGLSYWNRQFQFSAILPDFADCLAAGERDSAAVARVHGFRRIDYGRDPRQFVEVMDAPDTGPVRPVYIHGGYWRALTAEAHRYVLPALAGFGGPVGNIEYRLMPGARMTEVVADATAGLRAFAALGDRTKPLLVIGHSAGAHLALEAVRHSPLTASIAAIVPISGIYDLRPLPWTFLQDEINLTDDEITCHSPIDAPPQPDRLIIALGADETTEFHRQAQSLAWAAGCKTAGGKAAVVAEPNTHHMTVLRRLGSADGAINRAIRAHLGL